MWQPDTDRRSGLEQSHALVVYGAVEQRPLPSPRGRPLASFLAQLIVSADPTLAPSRSDRTQKAAARYAETARVRP